MPLKIFAPCCVTHNLPESCIVPALFPSAGFLLYLSPLTEDQAPVGAIGGLEGGGAKLGYVCYEHTQLSSGTGLHVCPHNKWLAMEQTENRKSRQ